MTTFDDPSTVDELRERLVKLESENAELRTSKALLLGITEAMLDGVFVKDTAGRYVLINTAGSRLLGKPADEILGKNDTQLLPLEQAQRLIADDRHIFESGQPQTYLESEITTVRGPTRFLTTKGPIRNAQGQITCLFGIARDLTDRVQADALLGASEARFRSCLEVSPLPMALNDEAQRITFINPAFTKTFGYEAADIPTVASWWPQAYPDVAYRQQVTDAWMAELTRSAQTETPFTPMELTIRCKDGSNRTVEASAAPLGESYAGEHLVVLHDITARKQAEAKLLASLKENTHLRSALDKHAIVEMTDIRGRILFVNDRFCQMSGYNRDELLGQDHRMIRAGWHAEDTIRDLWATIQSGLAWQGELKNQAKDGTVYWVHSTILPCVDEQGVAYAFLVIHKDITDRKQTEIDLRHMSQLLEHTGKLANVGGWEVDIPTQKLTWTSQTFRIAELDSPSEPSLAEGLALFAPEARPVITAAVQAAMDEGSPYDLQLPIVTAKGRRRWVQTQGFAEVQKGKPIRLYGTFQDITERREAEQIQQRLLLDKVALLREVHHRVKNNLQVMTSLLRLEASTCTTAETLSVLTSMLGRIQAMAQLHETLRQSESFASPDSLHDSWVDLAVYLSDLSAQIVAAQVIHRDGVTLTLNVATVHVTMDQAASCGLLINELVSNCLKHAFPDGRHGEVTITLQSVPDTTSPNPSWCLSVRDTGVGLPPDFETRRNRSLGMFLADDLSRQAGGTLRIESTETGTTVSVVFHVELPADVPVAT